MHGSTWGQPGINLHRPTQAVSDLLRDARVDSELGVAAQRRLKLKAKFESSLSHFSFKS